MEVLILERDTYSPIGYVENYSSMIWTERYFEPGEFELKTNAIEYTRNLLPFMTLITHRDSDEVMYVDNHEISLDDSGVPELTIKGKTLDSFLQHRILYGPPNTSFGKKYETYREYRSEQAVALLLYQAFVNDSYFDLTLTTGFENYDRDPWKEKLPNLAIGIQNNKEYYYESASKWWFTSGAILPQVQDLLKIRKWGIRGIRPQSKYANIVTFNTNPNFFGEVAEEVIEFCDMMRLEVYNGKDRTQSWEALPGQVVFNAKAGHFTNMNYLFSLGTYSSAMLGISSAGTAKVEKYGSDDGLSYRIAALDAGEPAEGQDVVAFYNGLSKMVYTALSKTGEVNMFSGDITEIAPYKYKVDYDLGDYVTLRGDYGISQSMIVSEFIRTESEAGDLSYPGLMYDPEFSTGGGCGAN